MSGALSVLRDFTVLSSDDAPVSEAQQRLCDEAYQRGLQDGVVKASEAHDREMTTAQATLVASLADMTNDQRANADAFAEALTEVTRVLCPALAEIGYPEAVRAMVEAHARITSDAITICVHSDAVDAMQKVVVGLNMNQLSVEGDGRIARLQAEIRWSGGAARLDQEALAQQIIELSTTLGQTPKDQGETE